MTPPAPPPPPLLRRMLPGDCDELDSLSREVPGHVDPRAELGRELTRAWVACDPSSGRVIGYALGWWIIDELQVLAIATRPEARRRGVARALLGEMVRAAGRAGARRVSLEVARTNTAARRLYEGAGFRVFNVRRGYYRTGDDALEMELAL